MSKEQNFVKTAVIGHPIAHSKSPLIHNHWLNAYGLKGEYTAIDIAPEALESGVRQLVEEGYAGFNVTVPHKQAIIPLCDEVDTLARTIGAVNTVTIRKNKLYGTNTDAYGFVQNIRSTLERDNISWNFSGGKAVVLGAGGAARAIVYALALEGAPEIVITNRTLEKAERLVSLAPDIIKVVDWEARDQALEGANIIVNTTALGMDGQPPLDLNLSAAPTGALVTDIVYAPLMPPLLEHAKSRGNPIVTGIGMLLHQARPGFELWNGPLPTVTKKLETAVLEAT